MKTSEDESQERVFTSKIPNQKILDPRHQETSKFWETALRKKVRKASTGTCPSTSNQPNLLSLFWWSKSVSHMCQKNLQHVIGPTKLEQSDTKSYTNLQLTWLTWRHGHRHLCFSGSLSIAIGFSSRSRHWQSEHVADICWTLLGNLTKFEMGSVSKICCPWGESRRIVDHQAMNFVQELFKAQILSYPFTYYLQYVM